MLDQDFYSVFIHEPKSTQTNTHTHSSQSILAFITRSLGESTSIPLHGCTCGVLKIGSFPLLSRMFAPKECRRE